MGGGPCWEGAVLVFDSNPLEQDPKMVMKKTEMAKPKQLLMFFIPATEYDSVTSQAIGIIVAQH